MKNSLESRRQKLIRELDRVNRKIVWTQKDLLRIESQLAALQAQQSRAA